MNIDRLWLTKTLSFLRFPVFLINILFLPSTPHCVQISCLLSLPSEVTVSQAFLVYDDLDGFEEDLPACFVEWPYITIWLQFSLLSRLRTYCCCYKSLIIWLRWCLLGFSVAKLFFFSLFYILYTLESSLYALPPWGWSIHKNWGISGEICFLSFMYLLILTYLIFYLYQHGLIKICFLLLVILHCYFIDSVP